MSRKKKLGKFLKKVGSKVASVAKKAGKLVGKIAKGVAFAPLLPFKLLMKKALASKGVSTKKMMFDEVAKQFYNKIVTKKDGFEDYEPIPDHFESDNFDPVTITMITTAIIKYVKSLKAKKKDGVPLTSSEETLVADTEKVEKKLALENLKGAVSEAEDGGLISSTNKSTTYILIGVAALALIFIISKK